MMLLASLPPGVRFAAVGQRSFHTSSSTRASVLFALGALSNSRETVHFNKISRLPRVEHSPPLKLIQTSEIQPNPLPTPSKAAPASGAWSSGRGSSPLRVWDDKALQVGRVFLSNQARQARRLQHALARIKRSQAAREALARRERLSWQQERLKLQKDIRAATIWILVSIGTATGLAAWRFFPGVAPPRDSADLGREIAARAAAAMPFPATVATESITASSAVPVSPARAVDTDPTIPAPTASSQSESYGWWKGLFWRQE